MKQLIGIDTFITPAKLNQSIKIKSLSSQPETSQSMKYIKSAKTVLCADESPAEMARRGGG
jgi:hypothetical protein